VIWKNAENKEWIESAVLDQLKAYAFRRLANTKVRLGFSSLPMDPKEIVSVPIACFYCTEGSSLLFGQHADLFLQERLRMFGSVADHMLEILEHFGYEDIDVEFVKERAKTFGIMTSLKHIPQEIEKRYALLQKVFESKGKFLTYELKDKSALKYLNLLNYHHKNSMIPFDYGKTAFDFRPFVLISYKFEDQNPDFQICRETFRPYFVVKDKDGLGPYYNQVLACISNVEVGLDGESVVGGNPVAQIDHRKLLGLCRIYINLTNELGKFPTFEEFTDYTYKIKRINENKLIRLFPIETLESIQLVFDKYAGLGANIDEFIEKTQKSVSIETRIEMEKVLKGNKSHWKEFIANAKTLTRG
jgi:phosphoenolpyruvate synthase/pyruvate phosphate dikinase